MSAPDEPPREPWAREPPDQLTFLSRLLVADDQGRAAGRPLLTADGLAYVQAQLRAARAGPSAGGAADAGRPGPRWDGVRQRLWLGGVLLKEFHRAAPAQAAVLDAFERLGWPPGPVPDPLPPDPAAGPADARRHLQETVKNLNRGVPAAALHFREDGGRVWCAWATGGGMPV